VKENGKEMRCDQNEINQLNRARRSSTMSMGAWQSLAFAMSKVFESSHSNEESNPSVSFLLVVGQNSVWRLLCQKFDAVSKDHVKPQLNARHLLRIHFY